MITASFAWREEANRWPPEKAYDVGGYFANTLEQEGHSWAAMPDYRPELVPSFRRSIVAREDFAQKGYPRSAPGRASKGDHRLTRGAGSRQTYEMVLWT